MAKYEIVEVRMRRDHRFFNQIKENLGSFHIDKDDLKDIDNQHVEAKVDKAVSEIAFYKCFLQLRTALAKTVYENKKLKLTDVTIEYMSLIMSKPMEFTMPANSKNSVQMGLANELGRSSKSAYSAINRLKQAGYLVVTEDSIIVPNSELQTIRKITKAHLEKKKSFPVSYMLNFIVK